MILFSLMACNNEPSMKRIDMMEKQISNIEKKYQKTETAFDELVDDCAELDEFLRNNNTPKPEMQLLRAYLQQYEYERDNINEDIEYSKSQISNLKYDLEQSLYNDSLRDVYLRSEEEAVNKIEAQLDYFLDRFEKQSEFVKNTVKQ